MDAEFFEKPGEQSIVKSNIVRKYFGAWSGIMANSTSLNMYYIDLFSGPGLYNDGTESTPMSIIKTVIGNDKLNKRLISVFNDNDTEFVDNLKFNILNLPEIDKLKHKPVFLNEEVDDNIISSIPNESRSPALLFLDPWGYKGVTNKIIKHFLKNWGSDCIFFFNYNRINMGISNHFMRKIIEDFFGIENYKILAEEVVGLPPNERELAVIEAVSETLESMGGKFVLPFRFMNDKGERTSHHLIFVSKHIRGYAS